MLAGYVKSSVMRWLMHQVCVEPFALLRQDEAHGEVGRTIQNAATEMVHNLD